MEFFFAVFFLLFYYLRPQDWVPGLIGLNLVKPIILVWLVVLISGRSRDSPLPGLLKTPHDWIIFIYYIYVAWTATDFMDTLKGFLPYVAFYALTVQSINTWPRLCAYFKWWAVALAVLALFAVLIPLGLDLTGGKEIMDSLKGRLSLGTWQHNNPNALGHSVIVLIPAAYFLFFWRGTVLGRFVIFPLIAALAFWCVYLTESKGAFTVGGIMVASLYVVGRPRFVQIGAIIIAVTIGMGALSFLPRMSQMGDLRSDEGVQGRLLAWEMARGVSETHTTGVGWKEFIAIIPWKEGNTVLHIPKATHSSYVQIAADLGPYGLFLYLAGLWCVAHTLLSFKPTNDIEDRCRRLLWILLISTSVSGWMINRQYHTEHFLMLGAAAALHRLRKGDELALSSATNSSSSESELLEEKPSEEDVDSRAQNEMDEARTRAETFNLEPARKSINSDAYPGNPDLLPTANHEDEDDKLYKKPLWNRFGIFDIAVCVGLTWLTFWVWDYILKNI